MSKYDAMTKARVEKLLDELWKAGMEAGGLDRDQIRDLDAMLAAKAKKDAKAKRDGWALEALKGANR